MQKFPEHYWLEDRLVHGTGQRRWLKWRDVWPKLCLPLLPVETIEPWKDSQSVQSPDFSFPSTGVLSICISYATVVKQQARKQRLLQPYMEAVICPLNDQTSGTEISQQPHDFSSPLPPLPATPSRHTYSFKTLTLLALEIVNLVTISVISHFKNVM